MRWFILLLLGLCSCGLRISIEPAPYTLNASPQPRPTLTASPVPPITGQPTCSILSHLNWYARSVLSCSQRGPSVWLVSTLDYAELHELADQSLQLNAWESLESIPDRSAWRKDNNLLLLHDPDFGGTDPALKKPLPQGSRSRMVWSFFPSFPSTTSAFDSSPKCNQPENLVLPSESILACRQGLHLAYLYTPYEPETLIFAFYTLSTASGWEVPTWHTPYNRVTFEKDGALLYFESLASTSPDLNGDHFPSGARSRLEWRLVDQSTSLRGD